MQPIGRPTTQQKNKNAQLLKKHIIFSFLQTRGKKKVKIPIQRNLDYSIICFCDLLFLIWHTYPLDRHAETVIDR